MQAETSIETPKPAQVSRAQSASRWLRVNGIVIVAYVLLVVVWQLASSVFTIPKYILPPPSDILARAVQTPGALVSNGLVTLQEVVVGFILGVVVSIPLGILIVYSRLLERIIYPFLVAFQAIPKVALAPILIVWFGFGITSKIMLGFVTAMFPIVINTVIGMNQTPVEMIHLMRSLGARPWQTFLKIRLYIAAPYIFGGLKIGITLAVVGAVVGEFIASNSGLGYLLLVANNAFDPALLFAVVVLLSIISIALFYLVEAIETLVLPRPLKRKRGNLETGRGT